MRLFQASAPFLLGILWTGVVGYVAARRLLSALSTEEKIAWGFGAGLLVQSAAYATLLLVGLRPRPAAMIVYGIVLSLALGRRRRKIGPEASAPVSRAALALLALAAIAWALFLFQGIVEPMWANDYLAVWGFKAKTIFLSSSVPARLFHDPATAFSHPEYPLLLPLALASLSALAGAWNDHALALLFPAIEAALLLALFGFLRRRGRALGGAVAALLASLLFFLFQGFEAGMADIPLAFAAVLVALSATDFFDPRAAGAAGRAAIASFLCCGFKQEGTLFVILVAAAVAVRSARGIRRARFLPVAALLLPAAFNGAILLLLRGSLADRDYDLGFLGLAKLPLLPSRFAAAGSVLLRSHGLFLAVPAAALFVFWIATPRSRLDWLVPVVAAQVLAYVAVCSLSSVDPRWQAQFVPRIAAALFPVLCAAIGDRYASLFEPDEDRVRVFPPAVRVRGT